METIINCEKHLIRLVCFCAGFLSQGTNFFRSDAENDLLIEGGSKTQHLVKREEGGQKRWWETWLQDTIGRWLATAKRLRACSALTGSSPLSCSAQLLLSLLASGGTLLALQCCLEERAHNAIFTRRPPLCWASQLAAAVVLPFTAPVYQVRCCVMKSTVLSWDASNCTERYAVVWFMDYLYSVYHS